MKIRTDIAELLHKGLPDRTIAQQLHCDHKTVAKARAALRLPKARRGIKPAATIEDLFRARTESVDGGHLRWTGYTDKHGTPTLRYAGRLHTAHRVAFRIRTGRDADGKAAEECGYEGCVEPSHVDDKTIRDRDRTALAAILGADPQRPARPKEA